MIWVDRSVLVLFGRSSWLKNGLVTVMIVFEAPPPGYAVLGVGAAGAPVATRGGSRFIASAVIVDKAPTAD